jgi:hypothetical protein
MVTAVSDRASATASWGVGAGHSSCRIIHWRRRATLGRTAIVGLSLFWTSLRVGRLPFPGRSAIASQFYSVSCGPDGSTCVVGGWFIADDLLHFGCSYGFELRSTMSGTGSHLGRSPTGRACEGRDREVTGLPFILASLLDWGGSPVAIAISLVFGVPP